MPRLPLKRATGKPAFQSHSTPASPPIAPALPSAPAKRPFTARQQAFIDNYVVSKNASDAARKAGYAGGQSAEVRGSELLSNLKVRVEVDRRLAAEAEKLGITAGKVRQNLTEIANGSVADFLRILPDGSPVVDFSAMTREKAAVLGSVTVEEFKDGRSDKREVRRIKFTVVDRIKANELLGKDLGMFVDRHDHKHQHEHTVLGMILTEIDAEQRGPVIEHKEDEAA